MAKDFKTGLHHYVLTLGKAKPAGIIVTDASATAGLDNTQASHQKNIKFKKCWGWKSFHRFIF